MMIDKKRTHSVGLFAAALLSSLFSCGLIVEALACLFPPILKLREGCWEGSCWFNSIDPLLGMNEAYPFFMLVGYFVGLFVTVAIARWAAGKMNRIDRLDSATERRRARVADRQPAAMAARTAQIDLSIAQLQCERAALCRVGVTSVTATSMPN